VGELVEMRAQVIRTGTTSMHIAVDVYSGDPMGTTLQRACHCVIVFVALNHEGKPKEVPKWTPNSAVDVALEQYAVRLQDFRKQLDQEMEARLKWLDEQRPDHLSRVHA
jgi:acyl-CoA hydrolase